MIDLLPNSWKSLLFEELSKPYFIDIQQFLDQQKSSGLTIYPPTKDIFNAFKITPHKQVKVVIIG